jgi:hypothetical protein
MKMQYKTFKVKNSLENYTKLHTAYSRMGGWDITIYIYMHLFTYSLCMLYQGWVGWDITTYICAYVTKWWDLTTNLVVHKEITYSFLWLTNYVCSAGLESREDFSAATVERVHAHSLIACSLIV